jgi:adenylosuccinate lyase
MSAIWAPENRFRIWLDIEIAATEALAKAGVVPKSAAKALRERGRVRGRALREDRARDRPRRSVKYRR